MGVPVHDIHDFSQYNPDDLVALVLEKSIRYGQIGKVVSVGYDFAVLDFFYNPHTKKFEKTRETLYRPPNLEVFSIFNRHVPIFNENHGYMRLIDRLGEIDWGIYEARSGRKVPTVVVDYKALYDGADFIGNMIIPHDELIRAL